MRTTGTVLLAATLAGLTLCGLMTAQRTAAQAPGFDPGAPGQQQDQGAPPPPPGGRRQGGFGRQLPFAMGTVTASDTAANTITIQPQFGGDSQTIQVASTTTFVAQTTVTVADLQVNDHVQIQGVPTGITASSIMDGQVPAGLPGTAGSGGFAGGPGGPFGPGGGGNRGGAAGGNTGPAFATATGTVTATDPLTISLSGDVTLTVKLASNAKITKISPVTLSSVKAGDRVVASGTANADGSFAATSVGVNLATPGFGGGFGQGGRRPRGNQGSGGNFPPPPGDNGGAPPPPPGDNGGAPPPPPADSNNP